MASTARAKQIDALMDEASAALTDTAYFKADRLASQALELARSEKHFGRMAQILMPLWEARRQRHQLALDVGEVTVVHDPIIDEMEVESGCYLIQPPQVGADARRLRLLAFQQEVPAAVVCREPLTMLKLCPIVSLSPGVTLRVQTDPPENPERPDLIWFVTALEELGASAIESLDPGLPTLKRLDALMNRLDAVPEHEGLHHALEKTCRLAEQEEATPSPRSGNGSTSR